MRTFFVFPVFSCLALLFLYTAPANAIGDNGAPVLLAQADGREMVEEEMTDDGMTAEDGDEMVPEDGDYELEGEPVDEGEVPDDMEEEPMTHQGND